MGKLTALLLALCMLPAISLATEEERPPAVRSNVIIKGYPPPIIPLSPRVDDSYFADILLVGDSLSSGIPHYKVMPALEVSYMIGVYARHIAESNEVVRKKGRKPMTLPDYLVEQDPRVVYIWIGLNDIEDHPAEQVLPHYHVMLNRLIEAMPNTLFCLMEVTPVTKDAQRRRRALSNQNVLDFNAGLYELAREHNIYLLQIHAGLMDDSGVIQPKLVDNDGFHLSRFGYIEVVDYLYTHTLPLDLITFRDQR